MKELKKLNKEQLVAMVCELEEALLFVESKLNVKAAKVVLPGRKQQVLEILQQGPVTIGAIATRLGISSRNVSSQLSYLRTDGYDICTSSTGKKFLA